MARTHSGSSLLGRPSLQSNLNVTAGSGSPLVIYEESSGDFSFGVDGSEVAEGTTASAQGASALSAYIDEGGTLEYSTSPPPPLLTGDDGSTVSQLQLQGRRLGSRQAAGAQHQHYEGEAVEADSSGSSWGPAYTLLAAWSGGASGGLKLAEPPPMKPPAEQPPGWQQVLPPHPPRGAGMPSADQPAESYAMRPPATAPAAFGPRGGLSTDWCKPGTAKAGRRRRTSPKGTVPQAEAEATPPDFSGATPTAERRAQTAPVGSRKKDGLAGAGLAPAFLPFREGGAPEDAGDFVAELLQAKPQLRAVLARGKEQPKRFGRSCGASGRLPKALRVPPSRVRTGLKSVEDTIAQRHYDTIVRSTVTRPDSGRCGAGPLATLAASLLGDDKTASRVDVSSQ